MAMGDKSMALRPGLLLALICSAPFVSLAAPLHRPVHIPQPDFWIESGAGGAPRFFVDSAVFPVANDSMRVETYYRVSYGEVHFDRAAQGYTAELTFEVIATAEGDRQPTGRVRKERVLDISEEIYQEAASYSLLYQVDLVLPRNGYLIETAVTRGTSMEDRPARAHWWANCVADPTADLLFGEVQLTNHIAPAKGATLFQKGGVEFYPNPTRRFSNTANTLVFYTENFNNTAENKAVHLRYGVQDLFGEDHWGGESGRVDGGVLDLNPGSNVLLSGFKLTSLATGFYRLLLEYVDPSGAIISTRDRVFSYQIDGEQLAAPDPYLSTLDHRILAAYGDRFLRYLASPGDISRYEALGADPARRRFIEAWWRQTAEEHGQTMAGYRAMILNRYEAAEERFAETGRAGWRTDRGRIFIVYGEPLEVVQNQFGAETKAGELWEMSVNGRRRFCYFLDRQGDGQFTLEGTDIQGESAARRTRPILDVGTATRF
jgi:GWxTD domain-containing protein